MRIALVTGAARRIGAAIAAALAADGLRVLVHYNGSAEAAAAVVGGITAAGGSAHAVQADLADRDAMRRLVPECTSRFGAIDVLVNNAASFRYDGADSIDPQSLDFHLRPNLEAPVFLTQAFAHALGDRPGCVVNMLDHKITALNPDFFSYTLAKVALAGATRLFAMAYAGHIRVNGIAPGITLLSGKQTEAGFARAWAAPPLRRSCTPGELANAVRFVLATASLNGEVLVLDGGECLLERRRDVAFLRPGEKDPRAREDRGDSAPPDPGFH